MIKCPTIAENENSFENGQIENRLCWDFGSMHFKCKSNIVYIYLRWSPRGRPWPRGRPRGHILKSLALVLASKPQVLENSPVLGSRRALFFEPLKFCWKTPETLRKICEHLFCFPQLEHRRRQGEGADPPTIEISPMTKMCQKSLLFLQFLFSIFHWQQYNQLTILKTKGAGSHSIQFLPANLNVSPVENGEFLS